MVDIFINPSRAETKNKLIENYKKQAKDYFAASDMKELFPNLFRILWYSSLPCTENQGLSQQFLLKSCTLAGENVSCSDIFAKVTILIVAKLQLTWAEISCIIAIPNHPWDQGRVAKSRYPGI